jgi:type VI secretion system FHA domain protein
MPGNGNIAMTLTLTILRCPDGVPYETRRLTGGELSIGRGPRNDWVLPDPDRVLSKQHCVVTFRNNAWQVTDTSANGTFLNHDIDRLTQAEPRPLRNGDRLLLGSYEIEAAIDADADTRAPEPYQAGPYQGVSYQGESNQQGGLYQVAPSRSGASQAGRSASGALFTDDRLTSDPFPPLEDDPLGIAMPQVGLPTAFGRTTADDVAAVEGHFRPPRPSLELLPEDWDVDPPAQPGPAAAPASEPSAAPGFAPSASPSAAPSGAPSGGPSGAPSGAPFGAPLWGGPAFGSPAAAAPGGTLPAAPPASAPPALQAGFQVPPAAAVPQPGSQVPQGGLAPQPGFQAQPAAPAPQPGFQAQPVAVRAGPADAAAAQQAFAAFTAGAGIAAHAPADPLAVLHGLGRAFRSVVSGLRGTMIARAAVKGEFRIGQTVIRAGGNNPLKFSADDDDALAALLGVSRHSDMTAERAIGEAMRDIRLHELAVATAMQQAVRDMLAALAPAQVARRAREGVLDALPWKQEARRWQAYEALHREIVQGMTDDFDRVFGTSFMRAYERAMRELSEQGSE